VTPFFTPLFADEITRTRLDWGRIQSNSDWILPIVVCAAILIFVRYMARRDAVEIHPVVGWILTVLRASVFLGLLVLYLQPHWRCEREVVRNSRVLLLVDTSLSMGQTDGNSSNRDAQVATMLQESDFLSRLRKTHDVTVYQFSEDLLHDRMISLPKIVAGESGDASKNVKAAGNAHHNSDGKTLLSEKDAVDWKKWIEPTGTETRLGQALRQLIHDERGSPISGIIVFTDGGQNAGIAPEAAVALAKDANIPLFTVGLGSERQSAQVRVSDLVVPARAYPGDRYAVTGYLQAQGMAGKNVTVQVFSRPAASEGNEASRQGTGTVVGSLQVTLGGDGEVLPVRFDLPADAAGRRTIGFRIQGEEGAAIPADHLREADIEIVDRKNHILLLASGPSREYQFLRSQLYRDKSTVVDVLLQTGQDGMSQDAKKILPEFPSTREQMYDYDCIVGFDPNWQAFNTSQLELLESWVGEQGGGLIAIAGPVWAGKAINGWIQDPAMKPVQNLYPVEFPRRLSADTTVYSSHDAWPLEFTHEGNAAEFLWLGDTASASREAWSSFPGVYSDCPVRGAKPGATVYAYFSDPQASQGAEHPVYFVGQFYGAGRVFYMGSGEMWRTRAIDESYFEQFYTKLIRHVSQGRLLRGSSRGVLLVGQDRYIVGNSVEIRAQLTNARLEPLDVPSVNLDVIQPSNEVQTILLRRDPVRAGAYVGQFQATQEGTYRLELLVPESERERLTRRIQVKIPDLERENPRRNDALLSSIAKSTGGRYYVGVNAIQAEGGPDALISLLPDRTNTVILTAASNSQWEETWLRWMMGVLCGLLCLEWFLRRLAKLA
jgi:hypothetical protein